MHHGQDRGKSKKRKLRKKRKLNEKKGIYFFWEIGGNMEFATFSYGEGRPWTQRMWKTVSSRGANNRIWYLTYG